MKRRPINSVHKLLSSIENQCTADIIVIFVFLKKKQQFEIFTAVANVSMRDALVGVGAAELGGTTGNVRWRCRCV